MKQISEKHSSSASFPLSNQPEVDAFFSARQENEREPKSVSPVQAQPVSPSPPVPTPVLQRKADDEMLEDDDLLTLETSTLVQKMPDSPSVPPPPDDVTQTTASSALNTTNNLTQAIPGFILDDDISPAFATQITKTAFLDELYIQVCTTTETELAGTRWQAEGCPYLLRFFSYFRSQPAHTLEESIHRYQPEAAWATGVQDYLPPIVARIQRAVNTWVRTQQLTEIPDGLNAVLSALVSFRQTASAQLKAEGNQITVPTNPYLLQSQLTRGTSLDGRTRSRMEGAFGTSFSDVNVHTDATASTLSSQLQARAFTVGSDIAFKAGEYRPGTLIGDALLAHELAHVVQQRSGQVDTQPKGNAYNALETDADTAAVGAVAGLWGHAYGFLKDLSKNALPRLKSGLQLQRCGNGSKETTHTTETPTPATPQPDSPSTPATTPAQPQPAVATDVLELEGVRWKPIVESDAVLAILSHENNQNRIYLIPARGLVVQGELPAPSRGAPQRGPILSMPAVGHASIHLIHTGQGTGALIDAAGSLSGQPIAMLSQSLAALQTRYNIRQIDGALLTHTHSDHLASLPDLIISRNISGNNIWVFPGWENATSGPLGAVWGALRDTSFTASGYGPAWQPTPLNTIQRPSASPTSSGGFVTAQLTVGAANFDIIGLGSAFQAYNQALQGGASNNRLASRLADAASMFTRMSHTQADYDIIFVGDMRGRTILDISNQMGPQAFNQFVGNARVIVGLHHLGAISTPQDLQGLQRLLQGMGAGKYPLTVVAQTGENFNEALVRGLQSAGVRVLALPSLDPNTIRSIVVSATGQVRANGASDYGIDPLVRQAQERVERMERAVNLLEAMPEHLLQTAQPKAELIAGLRAEIQRLVQGLQQRLQLATNQLQSRSRTTTYQTDLQQVDQTLERVEGVENTLGQSELTRLARSRTETEQVVRRLEAARRQGFMDAQLRTMIAEITPSLARQILLEETGGPMQGKRAERRARNRAMNRMRRQYRTQLMMNTGPRAVGAGPKAVAWFMIGIQLFELAEPFIRQSMEESEKRTKVDFYHFLSMILWWADKGVGVPITGLAGGQTISDDKALLASIQKRIWQDMTPERQKSVTMSPETQAAQPLDQLVIPSPTSWPQPEAVWDVFSLWISTHVNNFDDYAAEFLDPENPAIRRQPGSDTVWEIQVGAVGGAHISESWIASAELSKIMNATFDRQIAGTKKDITRTWASRQPPGRPEQQGPSIGPVTADGISEGEPPTRQPTRKATFNSSSRDVYRFSHDGRYRLDRHDFAFWDETPEFLVYENDRTQAGYVWASGGTYNTYGALRAATVWLRVKTIEIPSIQRTRDPNSPYFDGFENRIPPEKYMTTEQLNAWNMYSNNTPNVYFNSDDSRPSYRGTIEIWAQGPNLGGFVLLKKSDLQLTNQ